jgi:hypothetical protein
VTDIGAEVRLQTPNRHQYRSGYAEFLLDAGKQRRVLPQQADAALQARRHHPARKLLEALAKNALASIVGGDARIGADAVERRGESVL